MSIILTVNPAAESKNCIRARSGTGNEKENMNREKEIEAAEAKGLRPCTLSCLFYSKPTNQYDGVSSGPTCHKFQDLSPKAVFMSSAFDPTEQELKEYVRSEQARSKSQSKHKAKKQSNRFSDSDSDLEDIEEDVKPAAAKANSGRNGLKADGTLAALSDSDSEDEFPDLGALLKKDAAKKSKGKANGKVEGKAGTLARYLVFSCYRDGIDFVSHLPVKGEASDVSIIILSLA